MKFILSFLFTFVFISPVMAYMTNDLCQQAGCAGTTWVAGCEFSAGECAACQSGTYNDGNFSACQPCDGNSDYVAIQQDQTKQHPRGASSCADWECISGRVPVDTNDDGIMDICVACDANNLPNNASFSDSSCGWKCHQNYYRNESATECVSCPTDATTSGIGATSISQCNCGTSGQEIIANPSSASGYESPYFCGTCGEKTTYDPNTFSCVCNVTYSHQDTLLACACPENSTSDGTQCVCEGNYYMNTVSGHCAPCPADAECSNNEVTCDQNTIKTVNTEGIVTCATCGANASVVSNVCTCDVNAYGNGTNCTRCPAGTFLDRQGTSGTGNATAITDCQMNHNTQFCDANGQNCMQLIPES